MTEADKLTAAILGEKKRAAETLPMPSREAFEAAMLPLMPRHAAPFHRYKEGALTGDYVELATEYAWQGWQARDAEIAALTAEITDAVVKVNDATQACDSYAADNHDLTAEVARLRVDAQRIELIRAAVATYRQALADRQNGNIAGYRLQDAVIAAIDAQAGTQ